jgi:hypothetical protein
MNWATFVSGFTIASAIFGSGTVLLNALKDQKQLVSEIQKVSAISNIAKAASENIDPKVVESVVRVIISEEKARNGADIIKAQTGMLEAIVAHPDVVAELRKANETIETTGASAKEALKQIETISNITPEKVALINKAVDQSTALTKEVEKVDPAELLAQYVQKNGDTVILQAVDKKLNELSERFLKKEQVLDSAIAEFKEKIKAAEDAQKQYVNALNNKGDRTGVEFAISQLNTVSGRVTSIESTIPFHELPVGTILAFTGNTVPEKWVLANGSSYPSSCNLIGNAPDLTGRFLKGSSLASSFGSWTTGAPAGFSLGGSMGAAGNHSHSTTIRTATSNLSADGGERFLSEGGSTVNEPLSVPFGTTSSGEHTHSLSVSATGWDSETQPNFYTVKYIIKCR